MPAGRIILKSISESKKLSLLKTDGARLLYTWLILHVDVNGCFSGDPEVVNGKVFTRLKKSPRKIEEYLDDLAGVGLIVRYRVNGDVYLQAPTFEEKQPFLNRDREAKPVIPLPTSDGVEIISGSTLDLLRRESGSDQDEIPLKVKVKVKVKVKEKKRGEPPPLPPPSDPDFSKFLTEAVPEIRRIFKENGFEKLLENQVFYDYLLALCWNHRFLELGTELEKKLAHLRDKPPGPKSNLCLQFRNWFRLAVKFENERRREHRVGGRA
jgi:hypothetical protein